MNLKDILWYGSVSPTDIITLQAMNDSLAPAICKVFAEALSTQAITPLIIYVISFNLRIVLLSVFSEVVAYGTHASLMAAFIHSYRNRYNPDPAHRVMGIKIGGGHQYWEMDI